jgi:glycosyltransferase involved in cell wall biosynthesis
MFEVDKLPAIMPAPISVVLPVHNQEETLERTVESWVGYLGEVGCEHEIIVVDVGSTDQTGVVGESLAVRHSCVRVVKHAVGGGIGAALRKGLELARHPLVAYCDGNQYQPGDLKGFFKWIDEVHVVAGYRVQRARPHPMSWRKWASRWLIRRLFGVHMRDLGCLMLLARRAIFARIPIQSDGAFAHVEVLAKANFLGCLMTEVPVEAESTQQPSAFRDAWRLFFQPDFGPAVLPQEGWGEKTETGGRLQV